MSRPNGKFEGGTLDTPAPTRKTNSVFSAADFKYCVATSEEIVFISKHSIGNTTVLPVLSNSDLKICFMLRNITAVSYKEASTPTSIED